MSIAYVALGSNLGDKKANLEQALAYMQAAGIKLCAQSSLWETKPYGVVDQPDFLNAVVKVDFPGGPEELLQKLLGIEQQMGRVRKRHWGERNIDLDLILFEQQILETPTLSLPHPEMTKRDFVLGPLVELAPELEHPVLHKTMASLFKELKKASS